MPEAFVTVTDDMDNVSPGSTFRGIGSILIGNDLLDIGLVQFHDQNKPQLQITIMDSVPSANGHRRSMTIPPENVHDVKQIIEKAILRMIDWPEQEP